METIGELNILFDLQCSPCCKWFCNCDQGRWDGELKRRGRGERGGKRRWRGAAILFGSHLIREAGSPKSGFPLFRPPVHTVERALCTNLIAKAKAEILGAVKGGWMLQLKLRLKKPRMQEREREDRESEDYERRGLEMSREMELGGRVLNFGRNCSIAISQWWVRISNRWKRQQQWWGLQESMTGTPRLGVQ